MLVASFFLQMFALVSPLVFQVVIDKVLVNRSMSTLDVLAFALVGIAVFETNSASCARTYLLTPRTASTLSSAPASSGICSLSPSPISRRDASAILSPACANSRISETSSPARPLLW